MTQQVEGGVTYTQSFDVANRLTQVTASGSSQVTQFAYDASGQRLRTFVETPGVSRTITTYPFPQYEVEQQFTWQYHCNGDRKGECSWQWVPTAAIIRRTYMLGGQAIATRITGDPVSGNNGLFYLHTDHLGSTSMLTTSSGVKITSSETRYLPLRQAQCRLYGTHRLAPTTQLTQRDYTGQKENLELGLLYYNARFYVPGIGRFASADTIVPDTNNPQQFNRYTYALNNSIRLSEPTGHMAFDDTGSQFCYHSICNLLGDPYHRVRRFTVSQLRLVNEGKITDAEAMFAILTYAIEDVAQGDIKDGLFYAASVFYRPETNYWAPISTKDYAYQDDPAAYRLGRFGMDGFAPMFQDGDGNQVEHFINIAVFAAHFPSLIEEAAFLFEAKNGLPFDANAQADYELGVLAGEYVRGLLAAATPEERAMVTDQTLLTLQTGQIPNPIIGVSPGTHWTQYTLILRCKVSGAC